MNSPDNEQQLGLITGMRFPVQRTKVGSDGGDGDAEMQGAFIRGHPSDQQFCYRILGGFDIKELHECAAGEERLGDDNASRTGNAGGRDDQDRFCLPPGGVA